MKGSSTILRILALCLVAVLALPMIASCTQIGSSDDNTTTTTTTTTTENTENEEPKTYPLDGKTYIFLGSSVTYGSASGGKSFVEFIAENHDVTCVKFAVSGTTLVDNGSSSYVQRLTNETRRVKKADHLICQLSTNDATQNKPLGKVSDSKNIEDFDTTTIIGAMEYIIAFSQEKWNCHVSFYTGTKYDSALYQKMVNALYDLQEKWGIGIIDLWNDEEMNAVSKRDYAKYMSDSIHPTLLGYEEWWTPKFEAHLMKYE